MGRKGNQRLHHASATDQIRIGKYLLSLLFFLFSSFAGESQSTPKYWIQFFDKDGSGFSINAPEAFLSPRALARRARQNIPIDYRDLPLNPDYIRQVRALGATVHSRSKWFNAVTVSVPNSAVLGQILQLPFVKNSQRVARFRMSRAPGNKLDILRDQNRRNLAYDYGAAYTQIRMIGGDALHDMGFQGEGMLIAVLDAGFAGVEYLKAFELLREEGRIAATHNFIDPSQDVYRFSSHGCYVLSTMAAEVPGLFVGTAPRASYVLLVTEDVSSELLVEEDNWIAGAEFADSIGADVCNTSLGYTTFDDSTMDHRYSDMDGNTTRITRGADIAASRGMLMVNSAGNSGNSNWRYIGAPADGDSVLAVGAVNRDSIPADFSSYGPAFDGDIKPNVAAIGWGTYLWSFADSVRTGSGTSFSGPIIAGMAACLWQAFPEKNNMDIFHAIERSGHRFENPDDRVGYGIPNFSEAAFYLAGGPEALLKDSLVTVSPNPTDGKFQIAFRFEEPRLLTYSLFDISGQLHYNNIIYAYPGTAYAIPVFALKNKANGVYLLRVDVESPDGGGFHRSVLRIIKCE